MRDSALVILVMAGLVLGLVVAAADAESGLSAWMHLRGELADARGRIDHLRADNAALQQEVVALRQDDFAIERAIREDLELAQHGETVVRFKRRVDVTVDASKPDALRH